MHSIYTLAYSLINSFSVLKLKLFYVYSIISLRNAIFYFECVQHIIMQTILHTYLFLLKGFISALEQMLISKKKKLIS